MIDDGEKIRRCLQWAEEHPDEAENRFNVAAFEDMRSRMDRGVLNRLSERQHAWVADVFEKLSDEPSYLNLVSGGKVSRGLREVPTPTVLQKLPLKPPGRR